MLIVRNHFNEQKALALAALFLRSRGGEMKHLKLVKLMYLADREAFRRWGHSITGDRYVSMKYGPVLSTVLDLIHESAPSEHTAWADHIVESQPHTVKLVKDATTDALSDAEENLAAEIFSKFGSMNRWALVEMTHKFPEFKEPDGNNKRRSLSSQDVLVAVGKTPDEASDICRDRLELAQEHAFLALK